MRNVVEILDELQIRAGKDPDLRKQLLGRAWNPIR